MEKITRTDAPDWLTEKWKQWGEEWAAAIEDKKNRRWDGRFGEKKRKQLLDVLLKMTQYHCSFCDGYRMQSLIPATIEHFRPKSRFPLVTYQWENLFACCGLCQCKGDKFDERLLKPDDDSYNFDDYFDINWVTGELIPNRDASAEDRERARITIEIYRLNTNGKPEGRLIELENFEDSNSKEMNRFSYRFFLKRGQF